MINHDFPQGSPAWHQHRATHFNASDAPAMMGCSPYTTRQQLLHQLHTGIAPEVDPATQRRFDDGHRAEALARPLAEKIIGEELYPVTGSEGDLSASFDGLTMGEDVAFEHKLINEDLRAAFGAIDLMDAELRETGAGRTLPLVYRIQMEQQCMVAKCGRILFMASKWAADGTLLEERHCWYSSDPELAAQIRAGWAQFAKDLAEYRAPQVIAAPVAKPVANLPVVLDLRVKGELVASNLEQYKPAALAYIEAINTKLTTDQDFADADADAKFCRDSADKLKLAIQQALGQMGDINTAITTVKDIAAAFDAKGLALEKLVKAEKENRRTAIVVEAQEAYRKHLVSLVERIGKPYLPSMPADFAGAVKGLKSLDSMRDKVAAELARAKIAASAVADKITANLKLFDGLAGTYAFLFNDISTLVHKDSADLEAVIENRIGQHKAREAERLEKERERIRVEEEAKARKRLEDEQAARLQAGAATLAAAAPAQVTPLPAAIQRMVPAGATDVHHAVLSEHEAPTMALGALCARLGFTVTADFLTSLGHPPRKVERAARLYRESDFQPICAALIKHLMARAVAQPEALAA